MMYSTLFIALMASPAVALRPDLAPAAQAASHTGVFQSLLQLAKGATTDLSSLDGAKEFVDSLIKRNATEHLSDDDTVVLREVLTIIENTMLGSMDSAHAADQSDLANAANAASACNAAVAVRLSPGGDIHALEATAENTQEAYNAAKVARDGKQETRDDAWSDVQAYVSGLREPRECAGFPSGRSFNSMELYYESNEYVAEYLQQQEAFSAKATTYKEADAALAASLASLESAWGLLTVEYCAWTQTLSAGCDAFNTCFQTAADKFGSAVSRVEKDMDVRQKAYAAAVTIIAHVKFLLGEQDYVETVSVSDPDRFVVAIPTLASAEECDVDAARDRRWSPDLTCDGPVPKPPQRAGQVWTADESSAYELVSEAVSFDTAKQRCADLGGYAATVTNDEENRIVGKLCSDAGQPPCWIGFNDEAAESVFVWDDGTEVTYTNWRPNEPNDAGGEDATVVRDDGNYGWNDLTVAATRFPVCIVWSSRWSAKPGK